MYPDELRYSKDHEWVRAEDGVGTIGITDYAANELGDVVFIELPEVGAELSQFAPFGVVESVKAVSDLFAPVSGRVTEVNDELVRRPELLNSDAYGEGWICRVDLRDPGELDALMDAGAYAEQTAG